MAVDQKTTALAPFEEMQQVLAPYPSEKFIHLLPTTYQGRSDLFRPSATVVQINANDKRQVYPTPGGGGGMCLHSQALERIGNAAGLDFDPRQRIHAHEFKREPWICDITVGGWYTDSLGQRRRVTASAKMDLNDGTPRSNLITRQGPKALEVARQFICEQNESRARNRAIRATCNLPSSFTPAELAKPMVAIRFRLDDRDPDVKRALIEQGTRAGDEVFGRLPEGAPIDAGRAEANDDVLNGQVVDTTAKAAEPEIPDEEPAKAQALDVAALRSTLEGARAKLRGNDGPANPELVLSIGIELRDALDLRVRMEKSRWPDVRLAVVSALWGVTSTNALTARQAAATLSWLGTDEGKAQARALFDHLIAVGEVGPAQQTLGTAAQSL